jgi:hypothetical protein
MSLPASVNYSEPLHSLPAGTSNFEYVAQPVNGASFGASSQIIVDLGNAGFLDPASLFFRYKITYTCAADADSLRVVGTPAYTPFARLDTLINSQQVESVNLYNAVANLHTNLALSISDKLGQQYNLGFENSAAQLDNENTDGAVISGTAAGTVRYYSAPLLSILGFSDKLVPLSVLNNVRLVFTLDTLANIQSAIAAEVKITGYTISNFEICYNAVQFPAEVEKSILMSHAQLQIKTMGYASSTAPQVANGTSGATALQFNMRYASVRSAFMIFAGADATKGANRNMDSYDITNGNGDIQFSIAGIAYPQRPMNTLLNKAGVMSELRKAMGTLFGSTVAMSITKGEFEYTTGTATTVVKPAKFWASQSLMKLTVPGRTLFNGVSTQLAPINVNLNINTATSQAVNPTLVLSYDAVIQIDTATRNVLMVQ